MEKAAESWTDPATWMQIADRFGVAVLVISIGAVFFAVAAYAVYLGIRRVYVGWEPVLQEKVKQVADSHSNFMKTAAESIDVHAKANAAHAAAHAVSAESLRAISEAVEEGIDSHRDRLSDLIRIVHGGLSAVGEGLEELEEIHKDNPPMLKAIAKFRLRLAGMRDQRSRKKLNDSDG